MHWFSIINSCVTVLLLTGFLATILARVLKADFVRYSREDGVEEEEAGWKYVHGDVFRWAAVCWSCVVVFWKYKNARRRLQVGGVYGNT